MTRISASLSNAVPPQGGVEEQFVARNVISRDALRRFAHPNPCRWLLGVGREWTLIGATVWLAHAYPSVWLWVIAILFIGARQHGLGIMAHEGTHFLVCRSKVWNDLLANLLAAYPLTYTVEGYRTHHLEHHRWLETPRDPEQAALNLFPREWSFPMPRRRFGWLLLRDVIGGSMKPASELIAYIWAVPGARWPHVVRVGLYHLGIFALAFWTGLGWEYLVLWLVPLVTIATMCFRVRTAAEHSAIGRPEDRYARREVDAMATTRTTLYGPLVKLLFGPHNMAYHIEHHLFPSVPVFQLRALHHELMKNSQYAGRAHVTRGSRMLLRELTYG